METFMLILELVRRSLQRVGPYLLLEILLPGGTLLAVALFLYQRRKFWPMAMSIPAPADRL